MAFTVKQLTDEPIILITYRRIDSTIDEATIEGQKIAQLLREIGDFAYIILDLSGHKNSYKNLYGTIQDALKKNSGKMSDPSHRIVIIGSSSLVQFHQNEIVVNKLQMFCWTVTNNIEHAFEIVRDRIQMDESE